ncbi:MAG: MFS transporter [Betaproteobacteria bacterium HGW-Betaproteobacteria-22]|nr:MAG: MFS transporter [Betaproteobacteria bacterium HGW-Betaproteobacteria-22]
MRELLLSRPFSEKLKFILGFVLLTSFAGLGIGIARLATTLYAVDLKVSEFQLGVIASAQSVGILLMSLPVGILIHKYHPLRLFVIGSFLGGIIYAVTPLVRNAEYLIFCTVLVSFCMPFRFISLNSVFMQQLEMLGNAKAGWFRGIHMMGFFLLGPVVAAFLIESYGYVSTFFVIAASFLITILLAPLALSSFRSDQAHAPKLEWQEIKSQLSLLREDLILKRTSIIEFLNHSVMAFFGFFIVVIAIQDYGFSAPAAAGLLTAHGAVFVATLFTTGVLITHWGHKVFYRVSFAIAACALLVLAIPDWKLALWVGSLGLAVGLGMLHIVNFTMYAQAGKQHGTGRVSGLTALVGPSGGFFGSLLGGWIGHFFGLQSLFLPMGLVFLWLIWYIRDLPDFKQAEPVVLNVLPEIESEI